MWRRKTTVHFKLPQVPLRISGLLQVEAETKWPQVLSCNRNLWRLCHKYAIDFSSREFAMTPSAWSRRRARYYYVQYPANFYTAKHWTQLLIAVTLLHDYLCSVCPRYAAIQLSIANSLCTAWVCPEAISLLELAIGCWSGSRRNSEKLGLQIQRGQRKRWTVRFRAALQLVVNIASLNMQSHRSLHETHMSDGEPLPPDALNHIWAQARRRALISVVVL
jgi:hypothetical protein